MDEYFNYKDYMALTSRAIQCYDNDDGYPVDNDEEQLLEDLKDRSDF